jgi:hypothetical protein
MVSIDRKLIVSIRTHLELAFWSFGARTLNCLDDPIDYLIEWVACINDDCVFWLLKTRELTLHELLYLT